MEKYKFVIENKNLLKHNEQTYTVKLACGFPSHGAFTVSKRKPYFSMLSETGTVRNFIHALVSGNSNSDTAPDAYISKIVPNSIDLNELASLFGDCSNISYPLNYCLKRDICDTYTSVVTMVNKGSERSRPDIIHIKMINEPDMFGKWKIYQVERENT